MANVVFNKLLPTFNSKKLKQSLDFHVSLVSSISGSNCQDLLVNVTKRDDPMFLYTLRITDADFQKLKAEQNLLIDFSNFHMKLTSLLDSVIEEDSKSSPKFVVYFTSDSNSDGCTLSNRNSIQLFEIVESNPFKHLVHLALRFKAANEDQLRNHLADSIKTLKEEKTAFEKQSKAADLDLKRKLQLVSEELTQKSAELDKTKSDLSAKVVSLSSKVETDVEVERERCKTRMEQLRNELEQHFNREKRSFENHIKELESDNSRVKNDLDNAKDEVCGVKIRLVDADKEIVRLKDLHNEMDKEILLMERKVSDAEKDRNAAETRYSAIEQELQDKEAYIHRTQEMYRTLLEQKQRLEEMLHHKSQQLRQAEGQNAALSTDVQKGVEIIQKLSDKMKVFESKSQMRAKIASEQEKVIKEKETIISEQQSVIASLQQQVDPLQKSQKDSAAELETTKGKLREAQDQLQQKQSVIQWMNKRIDELQLSATVTQRSPLATINQNVGSSGGYKPAYTSPSYMPSSLSSNTPPTSVGVSRPMVNLNSHFGSMPAPIANTTAFGNFSKTMDSIVDRRRLEPNIRPPSTLGNGFPLPPHPMGSQLGNNPSK